MDAVTVHVIGVLFVATLVRSAFGFGEALVAVPLLAMRLPVTVAAPVAVLISILVAAVVVVEDHEHIHVRSAKWLVLATFAGIPLGLWMLKAVDERVVKVMLGCLIVAFSAYSLGARTPPHLKDDRRRWMIGAGFLAGILGGAYGMNGPPLVVYGSLRRWSAQHFRATLQAYFLPASLVGVAGYAVAGLLTRQVLWLAVLSVPGALVAIGIGRAVNRRLKGHSFLRYVHVGLLLIGVMLLLRTLVR